MIKDDIKDLMEEATELINCGNSREQMEGYGKREALERLNLSAEEIKLIAEHRLGFRTISWGTIDFKLQAKNEENPEAYDESLYQEILDNMIDAHDANNGITWETVSFYLNNNCLKGEI